MRVISRQYQRKRGPKPVPVERLLETGGLRIGRHARRILEEAPDGYPWDGLKAKARQHLARRGK